MKIFKVFQAYQRVWNNFEAERYVSISYYSMNKSMRQKIRKYLCLYNLMIQVFGMIEQ